jgi:hypothetical protein
MEKEPQLLLKKPERLSKAACAADVDDFYSIYCELVADLRLLSETRSDIQCRRNSIPLEQKNTKNSRRQGKKHTSPESGENVTEVD